jgi:hypothetical protein
MGRPSATRPRELHPIALSPIAGDAEGLQIRDAIGSAAADRNNVIDLDRDARRFANLVCERIALKDQVAAAHRNDGATARSEAARRRWLRVRTLAHDDHRFFQLPNRLITVEAWNGSPYLLTSAVTGLRPESRKVIIQVA